MNILDRFGEIDAALTDEDAYLRLESPGQDFEVEKQFLALGAEELEESDTPADSISVGAVRDLAFDRGRILCPRQTFLGFRAILRQLKRRFSCDPNVQWLNPPRDVALMFEKRLCQLRLREEGIVVPPSLSSANSFEALERMLNTAGCSRVFVKLSCGSSASGVVAFATSRGRFRAYTTVELVPSSEGMRMYNSRRVRCYERLEDVRTLFDLLCREGVQVEEWLPKADIEGESCDLRVLMIAGQVRHIVLRRSRTPFTNLHLLNHRGDPEELRRRIVPAIWEAAMEDCRRVAALFRGSLHVGIDLMFTRDLRRHAVLEANAFGDLLGGVLWNGLTTHEAELQALEEGWP